VHLHRTETPADLEASACDLSETGIGLYLPYPLGRGKTVILHLRGRMPALSVTVSARVIRATAQYGGLWRVGCQFERKLNPETLLELANGTPVLVAQQKKCIGR
jgi:hypothetical protein